MVLLLSGENGFITIKKMVLYLSGRKYFKLSSQRYGLFSECPHSNTSLINFINKLMFTYTLLAWHNFSSSIENYNFV